MNKRLLWSRILCIVGAGMIIIALAALCLYWWWGIVSGSVWLIHVLAGAIIVLPVFGSGLVVLGAPLGKSHYRKFLYAAFPLTICGLITAFGFVVAGFDGPGLWWALRAARAYLIGPIMSCVGAVLAIIESFHRSPIPQDNAHVT